MTIPDASNFFASITGNASKEDIAQLYRVAGWRVRKCGWTDYEARSELAEITIDGGERVVLHGPVCDPVSNVAIVMQPLRDAAIGFSYECYDIDQSLLLEEKWEPSA